MTEKEWLTSDDPVTLLSGLHSMIPHRMYLLFELESTRPLLDRCQDDVLLRFHELGRQKAEGRSIETHELEEWDELFADLYEHADEEAREVYERSGNTANPETASAIDRFMTIVRVLAIGGDEWWPWIELLRPKGPPQTFNEYTNSLQLDMYREALPLLRCIVGNPFRPVSVDPSWLTSTTVELARGIYDDRAFDRLPILADALEDAGCDHPDILAHCRGDGPHARGCWVVDRMLGKS